MLVGICVRANPCKALSSNYPTMELSHIYASQNFRDGKNGTDFKLVVQLLFLLVNKSLYKLLFAIMSVISSPHIPQMSAVSI